MAYREFRCKCCGHHFYRFENELDSYPADCDSPEYEKLPPAPTIIHTTDSFMSEAIFDSADTASELDRILTREVRQDKQDKLVNEARRNM
jgi:hypothetical protein